MAGEGSNSYWAPYHFLGYQVLSLHPVTLQEGANKAMLIPAHLPWLRGRSKCCCPASERCGVPCSPGPKHARKDKERRQLVPVLLCRWNLSCSALALYELAANLNQLFSLICNHWGNTGTCRGCSSIRRELFKADGMNCTGKVSFSLSWWWGAQTAILEQMSSFQLMNFDKTYPAIICMCIEKRLNMKGSTFKPLSRVEGTKGLKTQVCHPHKTFFIIILSFISVNE